MEPALVLILAIGALLSSLLTGDLLVGGARRLASASLRWPTSMARRAACITTVAVVSLLARPVASGAATPPPPVRIVLPTGSTSTQIGSPAVLFEPGSARDLTTTRTHTVERGECLWRIARATLEETGDGADRSAISRLWRAIYEANKDVIGPNPDLIHPGQVLMIPEV